MNVKSNNDQTLGGKKAAEENPFERFMIFVATFVLTLVSFLFAVLLVVMALSKVLFVAGRADRVWAFSFTIVSSLFVALLTSVVVARRSGGVFRKLLAFMRSRLPEPGVSCIAFSALGSLVLGAVVPLAFPILGHARPIGWDADKILPMMGFGFALFLLIGLQAGLIRKRGQKP
jgi:hypothetical protein